MPNTRRRHSMGLGQRKEKARECFIKGWSNAEVAREVGVTPDTAKRYRDEYQADLKAAAAGNPNLLRDVVHNTLESLGHLDRVRAEAWKKYESSTSDTTKATFLNTVLKAESERAKILGLMGVKGDTLAFIQRIKAQQDQLIEHMKNHLCDEDRTMLIDYVVDQFADDLDLLPTAQG